MFNLNRYWSIIGILILGSGLVIGASLATGAEIGKDSADPQNSIVISDRDLHRLLLPTTDGLDKDLIPLWSLVMSNGTPYFGRLERIALSSTGGTAIPALCHFYAEAKGDKTVPLRSVREIIRQNPRKEWSAKNNERALASATRALGYLGESNDQVTLWRILQEKRELAFWSRVEWDCGLLAALGQLGDASCQERLKEWAEVNSRGKTESELTKDLRFETAYQAIGTIEYRKFVNGLPNP